MTDIYRIEPLPPQLAPDRAARLAQVEAATLGHYLHAGFVDTAIRPLIVGPRVAGNAVTMQITGPDSTLLYYAMDRVRPGDLLVIDRAGDHRQACWGGFMAAVARIRGLAGVVISFAAYFSDSSLDTINYCNVPLTYINPQIENQTGIITDTLNWVPITGTFVASGNEKYMVLGNFKSDVATNTLLINPTFSATLANDVCIDDVSVIDIDLPAYAGPDVYGIPNNTLYIGRQNDVGIDEACKWYHLPNTTSVSANSAGITVTVATTTQTYMVKQDICGIIKYDTVIVYASGVNLTEQNLLKNNIKVYPIPAQNEIELFFGFNIEDDKLYGIYIYNFNSN